MADANLPVSSGVAEIAAGRLAVRESSRFLLYLGAALCVLYLGLRYIIPFILKALASILGFMVHAVIMLLAIFGLLWLVGYISKASRR